MKDYLIKFFNDGRRGTTYADGVHYNVNPDGSVTDGSVKVQELLAQGFVFVDVSDYFNLLGNNADSQEYCRRLDGTFIPYVPPEPTAEEIQAAKLSRLDNEYAEKLGENKNSIIAAAIVDLDNEYADKLRQTRQALQNEYIQKRGEL